MTKLYLDLSAFILILGPNLSGVPALDWECIASSYKWLWFRCDFLLNGEAADPVVIGELHWSFLNNVNYLLRSTDLYLPGGIAFC